ncbi:MAG: serine/threonine-protein kinase [Thermodesulfobacteriota bacterium]|nr:serine/threonine-protein kinase [Thermodesulfobacteriota bacterium]
MLEPILRSGLRVEDYIIEKRIGRGGMAELFLARDMILKHKVVIKVLNQPFSTKDNHKRQFLREAKIQANLDNPYIVRIFRIFDYDDYPCMVMQYIRGTDLEKVIKRARSTKAKTGGRGALSIERSSHIFIQILEGMGFVHKYGIVHGDIKPSNIILDKQGRAKIADFGLSFLRSRKKNVKREILPGGTPYYMSPEQILHEEVDFRSDIYSLGVTFYYMLTGELPLGDKKKIMEVLESHLEGSLEKAKRTLDEYKNIRSGIKRAILKALERDPDNRHQSCLEFSLAIKGEVPYEMYSELLRLSLFTKNDITLSERAQLDKISEIKGLHQEEAEAMESNIRKEMRLPRLDFTKEYKNALTDLFKKGKTKEAIYIDELEKTYVEKSRISKTQARLIREEVREIP